MAIRYVKDFEFPSAAGYTKSSPSKVTGQMLAKGGKVEKEPKGMMVIIGVGKPKGPMRKADGGGINPDDAGTHRQARRETGDYMGDPDAMYNSQTGADVYAGSRKRIERFKRENQQTDLKRGGKVEKVMHEFGEGKLHSGSKKGPKVTNPKQAIAIALSEERAAKKAKGGDVKSVPVKDIKSGKVPQSTDEDYYGKAKDAPMPPRRPSMLKKGGMPHEDVKEDTALIKSMVKPMALKKADGGGIGLASPRLASPLQQMGARPRGVPVAPRAPMIAQQAAPVAAGGPRIGVGRSRSGKPDVGAIRAAMARAATQAVPENAPSMMKKGGKVKC